MLPLARNALRKLRTVRHPDVLRFIDAVETETCIWIATERVRHLPGVLDAMSAPGQRGSGKDDYLVWGLQRVSVSISYVHLWSVA